jgi:HSP20 family protein
MKPILWRERAPLASFNPDFDNWMESVFDLGSSKLPETFRRTPMPAVNLAESGKEFVATIEVPGLEEKDVSVQILGDQLVISGERKWEEEKKDKEFYRVESQYGAFKRVLPLPDGLNLDADAVSAKLTKGILEIHIPKTEPKPAAKIKVSSK